MMIFYFLCIELSFSIIQLGNFEKEILLSKAEVYIIRLNNYFIGDSLYYTMNPTYNLELINSNSSQNNYLIPLNSSFEYPTSISSFIVLSSNYRSKLSTLLYYYNSTIVLFYINTCKLTSNTSSTVISPIQQLQLINQQNMDYLLILTTVRTMMFAKINRNNENFPTLEKFNTIIIDLPEEPIYVGEGNITSYLLITGYSQNKSLAYFYRVSDFEKAIPIENLIISDNNEQPLQKIFAVSNGSYHYVISCSESRLIKYFISDDYVSIEDFLKSSNFASGVSSFKLSSDHQRLIIGISTGFMIVDSNLAEVFIKTGTNFYSKIFVESIKNNEWVLSHKDSVYTLFKIGPHYNILSNASFSIKETSSFMWTVISNKTHDLFIYGAQDNLKIISIVFQEPILKAVIKTKNHFQLTAVQFFPYESVTTGVQIEILKTKNVGIPLILQVPPAEAEFQNFQSFTSIPLKEYMVGNNVTINSVEVSVDNKYANFFSISKKSIEKIGSKESFQVSQKDYKGIIYYDYGIILYDDSNFYVYVDGNFNYSYVFQESFIEKMFGCGSGFLVYFQWSIPGLFYFKYFESPEKGYVLALGSNCLSISCSNYYLICLQEYQVTIFSLLSNQIPKMYSISTQFFFDQINDVALNEFNNLVFICKKSYLVEVRLDDYVFNNVFTVLQNETMKNRGLRVFSGQNYLIYQSNKSMSIYDSNFTYLKTFLSINILDLHFIQNFLILFNSKRIKILDTSQTLSNSTILDINFESSGFLTFSVINESLNLYILNDSSVLHYYVRPNFNDIEISINITNFTGIDVIKSMAYITLKIQNFSENNPFKIPMSLYFNGQSIFKNSSGIGLVQLNEMNFDCGDMHSINVDKLFLGQGLNGQVKGGDFVTLNQRFSRIFEKSHGFNFTTCAYAKVSQIFITVDGCNIVCFDLHMKVLINFTISFDFQCRCKTVEIVKDDDEILVAFGCDINSKNINNNQTFSFYEHLLYLYRINNDEISTLDFLKIYHSIDMIRSIIKVSGEFILTASNQFTFYDLNTFYSSNLSLIIGIPGADKTYNLRSIHCSYSGLYSLNYYYLADIDLHYDPLFKLYYIYTLDLYYGFRIFDINLNETPENCKARYSIPIKSEKMPFTFTICGQQLYFSKLNTELEVYYLYNWTYPVNQTTVHIYTNLFKTVQGSLRCSSDSYSQFVLFQMTNSEGSVFAHIYDTIANEMTSTVTNYLISTNSQPLYADFLNSSGFFMIINQSFVQIFKISPFKILMDFRKNCHKNIETNFSLIVWNSNNIKSSANFSMKLKYFEQNSIKKITLSSWEIAVIVISGILMIVVVILSFFLIRTKCRKSRRRVLFNYEEIELK